MLSAKIYIGLWNRLSHFAHGNKIYMNISRWIMTYDIRPEFQILVNACFSHNITKKITVYVIDSYKYLLALLLTVPNYAECA